MNDTGQPSEAAASDGLPIATLRSMWENAGDLMSSARRLSERDRDYYDNFDHSQWTPTEKATLQGRKQPVVTDNRIKRKVDAAVGMEMRGRVDPRAYPRTPDDEQSADIATKVLVFCDDITRFDAKRSAMAYNLLIEGYGGVEVVVRECRGYLDPDLVRLRWEEIVFDPYSREADFSDASFVGVEKWMPIDKAIEHCRQFRPDIDPAQLEELLESSVTMTTGSTYEDRPRSGWGDRKARRVRLAYGYYQHQGAWRLVLFAGSRGGYDQPSPYLDEDGKPANAIILQSTYVDRENRRFGAVRDMISHQDEINKRRSKLLHMLNVRQTRSHQGAIIAPQGVDPLVHLKRQMSDPEGHIEYTQDPNTTVPGFDIIRQDDQVAGQFKLLEESKQTLDSMGPNASLLGQLEGQHSGRAIGLQQQAGMAEMGPFYEGLRDWTLRVYRALWCRVRQFWTEPRWIRITGEEKAAEFVGINQPVMNPYGFQVGTDNAIAEMDVDIIIDAMPDMATLQQEEWEQLVQLAQSGVPIPPDVLVEASHLRDKQKLIEKLKGSEEQQAQQAQQAALQQRAGAAAIAEKEASAQFKAASAQEKLAAIPERQASAEVKTTDAMKNRVDAALLVSREAMLGVM